MEIKSKKMTIKEVAVLAKVSTSTVSIILNNKKGVSDKTRENVLKIISDLNFKPNQVARSLVQSRSHSIGMLVPDLNAYSIFPEIAMGINSVLEKYEYSLSIILTKDDSEIEKKAIEMALSRRIDGFISCSSILGSNNIPKLIEDNFPVVCLIRRVYNCPNLDFITVDNIKGSYMAAEHIIRMGHKKIGVLSGPSQLSPGIERYKGVKKAFNNYKISMFPELIKEIPFLQKAGYDATISLLELSTNHRPTAIICANDDQAVGACEAILDKGLKIGQDIAVIGSNNGRMGAIKMLELSTISQQTKEMGRLAAERLIGCIENQETAYKSFQKFMNPKLVLRKSCGFNNSYIIDKILSD